MRLSKKISALCLSLLLGVGILAGCQKQEPAIENEGTKMTATELAVKMGNGINLGNTMEATASGLPKKKNPSAFEQAWGQPITTKEMIQGMKDAGFDSIRIPVAWTNGMDIVNDDYEIAPEFIDRVKEIVDYAYAADMYVIVNDHWDGGWWGMFGSSDAEIVKKAWKIYESMWKQISEAFKDYDYHLIFESGNEEIGARLNDVKTNYPTLTADSGSLSTDEWYKMAGEINQKFVDVVRAGKGHNSQRFLLIAGINTDVAQTLDARFSMPKDTIEDKLLLSVHFYDPSNYTGAAGASSVSSWGVNTEVQAMNEMLEKLSKFPKEGIPVIIGEYGVLYNGKPMQADDLREGHIEYLKNFLANCDLYGYVPMLWDCNSIYDKESCAINCRPLKNLYADSSNAGREDYTNDEIVELAQKTMDKILSEAKTYDVESGLAWIMYSSSDWALSYAVGDDHPAGGSDGVVAVEPVVTGAGTYTTSLDFSAVGGANSFVFCALGIYDAENMFPGFAIDIDEVLINGEKVGPDFVRTIDGKQVTCVPYTTTDDGSCTRVNIYNGWVPTLPGEARTPSGSLDGCEPSGILSPEDFGTINSISVTFTVVEK